MAQQPETVPKYFLEFALENERQHHALGERLGALEVRFSRLEEQVASNSRSIKLWLLGSVVIGGGGLTGLNQLLG